MDEVRLADFFQRACVSCWDPFGKFFIVALIQTEKVPSQIRSLLNHRLGERRASMWFDGEAQLQVHDGRLQVHARSEFVADWIKRHFRGDLQAAAREALGSDELQWSVAQREPEVEPSSSPIASVRSLRTENQRSAPKREGANTWRKLEDFVPGSVNQVPVDAARRMAASQNGLRCLVVHGGCGVGKTHLLQGLCRARREHTPSCRIRYVPAEQFTNEYIHAVRAGQVDGFRNRMRRVDLLVIDDVHFLANKVATQSEFLHTLDALDLSGGQVALASDEHPTLIRKFGQSLVSRMLAGMVVRVEAPDAPTRIELTHRLSLRRGLSLLPEATHAIAERCVGGAREIEGMLSRVDALRAVTTERGPVGAGEVRAIFQQDDAQRGTQPVRLPEILDVTCQQLGVEIDQLRSGGRHRRVALARGLVTWLARDLTSMSFPEIARGLGRTAHSAVHGAAARVQTWIDADARVDGGPAGDIAIRELVARLRHILRASHRA